MAIKITLTPDQTARIDALCAAYGFTRGTMTAFCAVIGSRELGKWMDRIEEAGPDLVSQMAEALDANWDAETKARRDLADLAAKWRDAKDAFSDGIPLDLESMTEHVGKEELVGKGLP